MNRVVRAAIVAAAVLLILALPAAVCGCDAAKGEGFALYLPAAGISASQLPILSHIELANTPLVSGADIVSYSRDTHQIELTAEAFNRIAQLEVLVRGRAYVVCVDRQPIYTGTFYTPISSASFDGVVILKPLDSELTDVGRYVIQLDLGYPGPDFFSGADPRTDPAILESLEHAGKLL